jgi:ABC-type glycerol-3-phosphate transport system substrate-binding protein
MSTKWIKVFAILLTTLMVFGGVQAQENSEITFVFWNWGPEAQPGWEAILEDFNAEHPEITVNLLPVEGSNWGSYLDGVATIIAGGEAPDVMWVATEGVQLLVKELQLALPLDEYIERDQAELQDFLDDVTPAMLDAFKVDGQQYVLPYSWNNMVIYYNTARFEEAGLEPPAADWTREQFLETATALTEDADSDGTPERYGFAWDNGGLFTSAVPWVYANGGDLLTEDMCAPQVTSPEVTEALQFMHDLVYTHKVAPAPTGYGDIYNLFQNGDVAMFGAGRWPLTALIPAEFTDFDIALWPGNPDRITEFGIDGFPILNTSSNPDAAWEFVKFMTRADVQERLVGTADSPVSNVPARRSVAAGMADFPPENSEIFYGSLEEAAKLVPAPPRFNQAESVFLRYTGLIFADEMSVEDAMSAAQAELESIVTCQ